MGELAARILQQPEPCAPVREQDRVLWDVTVPQVGEVRFEASEVRRERTGIHARVSITMGGEVLAYDLFNVDRNEERRSLCSAAARRLGEMRAGNKTAALRQRMDAFCAQMWAAWLGGLDAELVTQPGPRPEWLIDGVVLAGGGSIVFAPPGSTKSYLGLIWAMGVQSGQGVWPCRKANALFVNLERSAESIAWRIGCVARALDLEPHLRVLNARGGTLAQNRDGLAGIIERHEIGCVFLDSLSRAGNGLIDASDANATMDTLNALGVSWVCLGHSPRADSDHVFGSVMFDAAADHTVQMKSVKDLASNRTGVRIEGIKSNDRKPLAPQVWTLEFTVQDELCGFYRADSKDWPDLQPASDPPGMVADYLARVGKASPAEIAEAVGLSRNRVSAILNESPRFQKLSGNSKGGRGVRTVYGLAETRLDPGQFTDSFQGNRG